MKIEERLRGQFPMKQTKIIIFEMFLATLFSSVLTAIVYSKMFYFILFGLGFSLLLGIGVMLCVILKLGLNTIKITSKLIHIFVYIIVSISYMIVLGGVTAKSIIIALFISFSFYISELIVDRLTKNRK
jgi:hypothetical protein